MNGEEILSVASNHSHTRRYFGGVFAVDLIPPFRAGERKFYIINTDYFEGRGKHWVLVNNFLGNEIKEWFDPLGYFPLHYNKLLYDFITKFGTRHFLGNTLPVQAANSDKCGYFCLMIGDLRSMGYSLKEILQVFDRESLVNNDHIVQSYVNIHMR